MFSKKDSLIFTAGGLLIATGYLCMLADGAPNGFGILTLWIAPPILLMGFLLPVFGILGYENISSGLIRNVKGNPVKHTFGFLAFLAAFIIYFITLEPTASLWDCSEFIASAYKLQVPHSPGTPLSLLIARIFTMFTFGDVTRVAWTINLMSGLFSSLTVWLLYLIIFHLGESLLAHSERHAKSTLTASSFGGSLCLAFSDTFWFSAVEAETYGAASFFLLLMVWLILTGKALPEPIKSRRLILIFYLAGISYCIHPMCLLALPVLPYSWYTQAKTLTFKNALISFLVGLTLVLFINRFVAIGIFELAFSFDLFFINYFHLPFYSGAVILVTALVLLFRFAIAKYQRYSHILWSLVFLFLGFIPYLMLFLRSHTNPPIDETNPENLPMIKAYMNRESYPSSPLLYGPYFDASIIGMDVKKKIYYQNSDSYALAGTLPQYQYDGRQTVLPRMYSNDPDHIETYRRVTGLKDQDKPRFADNLQFMFTYQLGQMYLRYFMWNFAGRESDIQNSDWLMPWERLSAGDFEKARNQYWMIPLLIGMLGAALQFHKDRKGFLSVAILFIITGLVLALYLNSTPNEPRERDYIYVGSYIAFCIWIGLGFVSITFFLRRQSGTILSACLATCVPLWMLYQNYDDHNRSGRTFQVDNARNILASCAPNSILFTGGDNDTFPLWYMQEVQGYRTDVRVMVLSYLNTDWYINQLRKTYYESPAFTLTLGEKDYRQYGANDVLYIQESIKSGIDVKQFLQLIKNEHPALRKISSAGEPYHILPSRTLKVSAGNEVRTIQQGKDQKTPDEMMLYVTENYLSKNMLAILDLIVSNQWERPIYFNFSSMNTLGVNLEPYLVQEGQVYRLGPKRSMTEKVVVNAALMYKNLVEKADYSNLKRDDVYFSYEDHFARMLVPIRQSFNSLAATYLETDNKVMAEKVLQFAISALYQPHLRPSYTNLQAAELLIALEKSDMAEVISLSGFDYYYGTVNTALQSATQPDEVDLFILREFAALLLRLGKNEYAQKVEELNLKI